MPTSLKPGQVVFTDRARCRDCYRCLRACPVKAIQMHEGQAAVVAERCISCGTCIRECPQKAKAFRKDVDLAARFIREGHTVAASIAPSFAAVWDDWQRKCLPSALRKLGFAYVGETAIGAYDVAKATASCTRGMTQPRVCTACPAVVNYVEMYEPDLIESLVPVVSPMIAHARHIKARLGKDAKVVFIGPCVAKKAEADRPEYAGLVDCVLTFPELIEWFAREGIDVGSSEESYFTEVPAGESRFFPLPGGLAKTASLQTDLLTTECEAVSGFADVKETLDLAREGGRSLLIEPLFCSQGCVHGPGMPGERNAYERRHDLLQYAGSIRIIPGAEKVDESGLLTRYVPRVHLLQDECFPEEAIRAVLEKTGKAREEDQLNCGACGYLSCRDKAIAVLRGMAEPEMCMPYMRRLAEQRTDRIIETSPNGIVIVDDRLTIIHMNPAFRKYFMCSEAICGKHISYLMDPAPFEKLVSGDKKIVEMTSWHDSYNLICHEILYALPDDHQFVGIFVNIAPLMSNQKKLEELREQTCAQAKELLEHQINMAQKMAQFLGESTARGEELVKNLLKFASDNPGANREPRRWDTSTSI